MNQTPKISDDAATASLEPIIKDAPLPTETPPARTPSWIDRLAQPILAIPLLSAVGALMFIANLGSYPFYTKGEPREAVTVLAMASGGGVILPMRAGVELPSKPLLMHWIAALLSMLAGGVNEWTVRMPSALFGLAGILVCYCYVRRLFEDRAAFIAALMLATSVQYLQSATGARVDMTLTFFLEVAFFEFLLIGEGLTRRRILLYVAIALAILAKGPVGIALPAGVALIWIAAQWRWDLLRDLRLARGTAIVAVLAGWWYVAASIIGGRAFIEKQLVAENFVRFVGAANFHEGHAHAFYYLEGALAAGFLPWTPLLALVFSRALRAPRRVDARLIYMLIWIGVVLGFYSLSHSKRGVYLLPLYPALATIIALYIVDAIDAPAATDRLVGFFASVYGAVLAVVGLLAWSGVAMMFLMPTAMTSLFRLVGVAEVDLIGALHAEASSHVVLAIAMPSPIAIVGIYLFRSKASSEKLTLAISAAMIFVAIGANSIVVAATANTLALKTFAADVLKAIDDHPVGYLLDMNYDVAFYSRRTIPIISFKDSNKPDYLICVESIWEQHPGNVQNEYQIIMTSNPTELDGSDRIYLLKKNSAPVTPTTPDTNV